MRTVAHCGRPWPGRGDSTVARPIGTATVTATLNRVHRGPIGETAARNSRSVEPGTRVPSTSTDVRARCRSGRDALGGLAVRGGAAVSPQKPLLSSRHCHMGRHAEGVR